MLFRQMYASRSLAGLPDRILSVALRDLLSAIHAQPEAMRRWIIADLRNAGQNPPGDDSAPTPASKESQDC